MKKIFFSFIFIAILLFIPNIVFGSTDTLPDPVNGTITLTDDVTLSKQLTIENDVKINLAGNKLTFTQGNNHFNAKVTIENGSIDITGVNHSADGIIEVGNYGNISGNLTFNNVKFTGDGYNSSWAVIYVYKASTLNIKNSTMSLKDEEGIDAGVIKAEQITSQIDIQNSILNFTDTIRGFLHGTILIKDSEVTIKGTELDGGLDNAINCGPGSLILTLDNTTLNVANATGRGITLNDTTLIIKNASKITISNCNEGEILVRDSGEINIDSKSYIDATISLANKDTDTVSVSGGSYKEVGDGYIIIKKHAITVKDNEGGSVSASTSEADVGDTITLTVDAINEGYSIKKIELIGLGTGSVETIENNQFIMPNEPVEVNVVFENNKQDDKKDDKQDNTENNIESEDISINNTQPEDTSTDNVKNNPKTGDNILLYVLLAIISIIGIIVIRKINTSKLYKNKK